MNYLMVENPNISVGIKSYREELSWFDEAMREHYKEFCQTAAAARGKETFAIEIHGLFGIYLLEVVYEDSIFELRRFTRAVVPCEKESD